MEKKIIDKIIEYGLSDDNRKSDIRKRIARNALNTLYKAAVINKENELIDSIITDASNEGYFDINVLNDLLFYVDLKEDCSKYGKNAVKSTITVLHNRIVAYYKTSINERIAATKDIYKELDKVNVEVDKTDIMMKLLQEVFEI